MNNIYAVLFSVGGNELAPCYPLFSVGEVMNWLMINVAHCLV